MASPIMVFVYRDRRVPAPAPPGVNIWQKFESVRHLCEEKTGVPPNTYDFYDEHGMIADREDLKRALQSSTEECTIEVREHRHYIQIRALEEALAALTGRTTKLERGLKASEERTDMKISETKEWTKGLLVTVDKKLQQLTDKTDELTRDRNHLQRQTRIMEDQLKKLNVNEVRQVIDESKETIKEMRHAIKRVDRLDHQWGDDKANILEDNARTKNELKELQRYVQGKIDVCIEADGDLRREQQLSHERMQLLADDLRLMTDEHKLLTLQGARVMEESEDLRTVLGQLRDDTESYRLDIGHVRTRVHCIEGGATEMWEGFAPGVLYLRQWHKMAKGVDVRFSGDLLVATARGFLASNGHVIGNDEGLIVGDAPCKRYGAAGVFASYFEFEIEGTNRAAKGVGGLYAGVSVQSGDEIAAHQSHEFDGWLIGGPSKVLVCRSGTDGAVDRDPNVPPATLAPGSSTASLQMVAEALKVLEAALPPRSSGEVQQFESDWDSQPLAISDRIGILFKCNATGGARLRVMVNGEVQATHYFFEAPPAEAIGFLTPVIRLAGTGKSVRILPEARPPPEAFVDLP